MVTLGFVLECFAANNNEDKLGELQAAGLCLKTRVGMGSEPSLFVLYTLLAEPNTPI